MNETITKALHGADSILKGGSAPALRSEDYERALMDFTVLKRRDGESEGAALVRLLDDRDETVAKLWAACDLARVHEQHGDVLKRAQAQRLVQQAEAMVDRFVKQNTRAGESHEAATARLAMESEEFGKLYRHAVEVRGLL